MVEIINAELIVTNNKAGGQGLQVNGPIGTEGFVVMKKTTIDGNEVKDEATQLNYPVAKETLHTVEKGRTGKSEAGHKPK